MRSRFRLALRLQAFSHQTILNESVAFATVRTIPFADSHYYAFNDYRFWVAGVGHSAIGDDGSDGVGGRLWPAISSAVRLAIGACVTFFYLSDVAPYYCSFGFAGCRLYCRRHALRGKRAGLAPRQRSRSWIEFTSAIRKAGVTYSRAVALVTGKMQH
jgi:hypothetical protein